MEKFNWYISRSLESSMGWTWDSCTRRQSEAAVFYSDSVHISGSEGGLRRDDKTKRNAKAATPFFLSAGMWPDEGRLLPLRYHEFQWTLLARSRALDGGAERIRYYFAGSQSGIIRAAHIGDSNAGTLLSPRVMLGTIWLSSAVYMMRESLTDLFSVRKEPLSGK